MERTHTQRANHPEGVVRSTTWPHGWLAVVLGIVVVGSQAEAFEEQFNQVTVSMTRAQVRDALGEPSVVELADVPDVPFWGPQEMLAPLGPHAEYEEWRYLVKNTDGQGADGDDIYYVWFAGARGVPRSEWNVYGTWMHEAGAVYESAN